MIQVTRTSILTGRTNTMSLPITQEQLDLYDNSKELIQNVMPDLDNKQREFEIILKEQAEKSNAEISNLKKEIEKIKIDGELINSASKNKAINPNQVSDLIRPNLRLDENGRVEVLDENKKTRYNNNGDPLSIDEAVNEFITQNPHFRAATPSGSGSVGNVGKENPKPFKLGDLDMTNPEDRKRYAEYKKERDSKQTVINLTKS